MLLNSAVSRNIQLSMDDPNVESHKGNIGYSQVSVVVDFSNSFFIYLKTKAIEHRHIIIKKYLNLNGLSFVINNSASMSSLDYNIANLTYCGKVFFFF